MKLIFPLPNGEQLDLFDEGPNGMDYICTVSGEYKTGVIGLVEEYEREKNPQRRLKIDDEIHDQAYYYVDSIAMCDEELQSMISLTDLAEQIYRAIITFARI
jgi:hypothetical protein